MKYLFYVVLFAGFVAMSARAEEPVVKLAAASGTGTPKMFDCVRSVPALQSQDLFYEPEGCRRVLKSEFGLVLETGNDSFDRLIRSTMLLQHDRVNPAGHLYESVGEINGASRYSSLMYPRTVGEAVYPMCAMGMTNDVIRFYDYMYKVVPAESPYWPHTMRPGAVASTNVQVDISADVLCGFVYLWLFTGDEALVNRFFPMLDKRAKLIMERHFHEKSGLVDSGNYNEQYGGTKETLCEIFTNMITLKAYELAAYMLQQLGRDQEAEWYRDYAVKIKKGIQTYLTDKETGGFYAGFYLASGKKIPTDWSCSYATRYHDWVDESTADKTYNLVLRNSMGSFLGREVWFGGGRIMETTTKCTGWRCGYLADTGRLLELNEELRFLADFTVQPKDILAEHYRISGEREYPYVRFGGKLDRRYYWVGYRNEPNGDYTIDSGNGEQTVMFLEDFIRKVIGVDWRTSHSVIAPRWPLSFSDVTVAGIRLPLAPGKVRTISYRQIRGDFSCRLQIDGLEEDSVDVELALPGPLFPKELSLSSAGQNIPFTVRDSHSVRAVCFKTPKGQNSVVIDAMVK